MDDFVSAQTPPTLLNALQDYWKLCTIHLSEASAIYVNAIHSSTGSASSLIRFAFWNKVTPGTRAPEQD